MVGGTDDGLAAVSTKAQLGEGVADRRAAIESRRSRFRNQRPGRRVIPTKEGESQHHDMTMPSLTTTRTTTRRAGRGARRTVMLERSWDWQDQAACRDLPLELFFGPDGEKPQERDARERRAVQVCAGCPVRDMCAAHAVALPEAYGVWGGTTESGRNTRRRRSSRVSAA